TGGRLHEGETILVEPPPRGDEEMRRLGDEEEERYAGVSFSSSPHLLISSSPRGPLRLTLLRQQDGHWLAQPETMGSTLELLETYGRVPLPWYIRRGQARDADRDRYQTVYAQR